MIMCFYKFLFIIKENISLRVTLVRTGVVLKKTKIKVFRSCPVAKRKNLKVFRNLLKDIEKLIKEAQEIQSAHSEILMIQQLSKEAVEENRPIESDGKSFDHNNYFSIDSIQEVHE